MSEEDIFAAVRRVIAAARSSGTDEQDLLLTLGVWFLWRNEVEQREKYAQCTAAGWKLLYGKKRNQKQIDKASANVVSTLEVAVEELSKLQKPHKGLATKGLARLVADSKSKNSTGIEERQVRRHIRAIRKFIDSTK